MDQGSDLDLIDRRKAYSRPAMSEERREAGRRYREINKQVKHSCRKDKHEWLEDRGREAQEAASKNDLKTLWENLGTEEVVPMCR